MARFSANNSASGSRNGSARDEAGDCTTGWQLSQAELLDYRHHTHLLLPSPAGKTTARRVGGYLSRHQGRGMEFVESRHYQPGDDIRAIDWRITARSGKTHTKLFQEEKERPVFIMADFSASMQFGSQLRFKSVQAAHLAALIGWQSIDRGDRLGALLFDDHSHCELRPRTRRHAVMALIRQLLSRYGGAEQPQQQREAQNPAQTAHSTLAVNCRRLRRLLTPGSQVYLLSDFYQLDDASSKELSLIARHNQLTTVELFDPLEQQLPAAALSQGLAVSDGRRLHRLLPEDQRLLEQRLAERQHYLSRLPGHHWQLGAHRSLAQQLTQPLPVPASRKGAVADGRRSGQLQSGSSAGREGREGRVFGGPDER